MTASTRYKKSGHATFSKPLKRSIYTDNTTTSNAWDILVGEIVRDEDSSLGMNQIRWEMAPMASL